MMGADMNEDPLQRSEQDHLTREAVLHVEAVRAMLKLVRGLDDDRKQEAKDDEWAHRNSVWK